MIPSQCIGGLQKVLKIGSASVFAACLVACAQSSAGPAKTEVLPADGGEIGKAYTEFASAVDAGDTARISKLMDPDEADSKLSVLQAFGKLSPNKPVGGRRQGDHATLFLQIGEGAYKFANARHGATGWMFDSPIKQLPVGIEGDERDCSAKADFPCALITAPDAIVSGSVTLNKYDTFIYNKPPTFWMLDGFAVRELDDDGKTLKRTSLFMSSMGIMPGIFTHATGGNDPSDTRYTLAFGLVRMKVAPDGKSADIEIWNGGTEKTTKVADGLTIEVADGKRMRGRLVTDVKDVAKFDLYFDIATASVYRDN